MTSTAACIHRLVTAEGQSRSARSVELFGWLIFLEAPLFLLAPHVVASVLHFAPLEPQATHFVQLLGLLVGGIGMLYIVSGRLDAEGFVFGSLIDRPLVPPIMALLWTLGIVPGWLALAFAIQDGGSWLWTLVLWRAERRGVPGA